MHGMRVYNTRNNKALFGRSIRAAAHSELSTEFTRPEINNLKYSNSHFYPFATEKKIPGATMPF